MPFHPAHEMHVAGVVGRRERLTAALLVLAAHGLLMTVLLFGLAYQVVKAPVLPKMVMTVLPRNFIPAPPVAPPTLHPLRVASMTAAAPDIVIESRASAPVPPAAGPVIATVPSSAMTMSSAGGAAGAGTKNGASGAGAAGRGGGDGYDLNDYLARVARHIQRHLITPVSLTQAWRHEITGTVLVHLVFRPDGSVQLAEIARSSGSKSFDEAALAAVRRSDPLPAFPPEVRLDHINGVIPVTFTITGFMEK